MADSWSPPFHCWTNCCPTPAYFYLSLGTGFRWYTFCQVASCVPSHTSGSWTDSLTLSRLASSMVGRWRSMIKGPIGQRWRRKGSSAFWASHRRPLLASAQVIPRHHPKVFSDSLLWPPTCQIDYAIGALLLFSGQVSRYSHSIADLGGRVHHCGVIHSLN